MSSQSLPHYISYRFMVICITILKLNNSYLWRNNSDLWRNDTLCHQINMTYKYINSQYVWHVSAWRSLHDVTVEDMTFCLRRPEQDTLLNPKDILKINNSTDNKVCIKSLIFFFRSWISSQSTTTLRRKVVCTVSQIPQLYNNMYALRFPFQFLIKQSTILASWLSTYSI